MAPLGSSLAGTTRAEGGGPPLSAVLALAAGQAFLLLFVLLWWERNEVAAPAWQFTLYLATLVAAFGLSRLAGWIAEHPAGRAVRFLPAAFTMILTLLAAEALLRAYQVPAGLIPTPTEVLTVLWQARDVLLQDTFQTFVMEAVIGFLIGVGVALPVSLLIARSGFLQRGMMPYAAAFSSIPIPALAPVFVHMFGLDWQSKAAVVAVTVFFPVVVNVVRGLLEIDPRLLDLMRSYAASDRQIFAKARAPNALPFFFNALKLGTTLAMIGAIVGEFFGATGKGLGFRIQIEAGRFGFDIVWAAIIVASTLGIAWFGLVAWLERRFTAWHVSLRE